MSSVFRVLEIPLPRIGVNQVCVPLGAHVVGVELKDDPISHHNNARPVVFLLLFEDGAPATRTFYVAVNDAPIPQSLKEHSPVGRNMRLYYRGSRRVRATDRVLHVFEEV